MLPSELPSHDDLVGLIGFDTETSGLHPDDDPGSRISVVSIAFTRAATPDLIEAYAWPFGQGRPIVPGDEDPALREGLRDIGPQEYQTLIDWLLSSPRGLAAHNAGFDVVQLAMTDPYVNRPDYLPAPRGARIVRRNLNAQVKWDTMVAAPLIWPRREKALKKLAAAFFGEDADAEQRALKPYLGPKSNPRYDRVPWSVMEPYAVEDARLVLRLLRLQAGILEANGHLHEFMNDEQRLSRAVTRMDLAGIPFDAKLADEQAAILRDRLAELEATLPFTYTTHKAKAYYFGDPETPVDLGKGLVTPLGLTPRARTDKGAPKLDADATFRLAQQDVPHAATIVKIQKYRSAISKWYAAFPPRMGADGRIRAQIRHVAKADDTDGGTKSGRFSAGRINLQGVPKDFKLDLPCLTPRQIISHAAKHPDWTLYDLDLAQAELRAAAFDVGCTEMLQAIRNGDDLHAKTAIELFNPPNDPEHPEFIDARQKAKSANFSLLFGSGAQGFKNYVERATHSDMPLPEAQRIVSGWRELYSEFPAAVKHWQAFTEHNRYVPLRNGRKRWYKGYESEHSAFNQRIQGTLAEYAKHWLLATDATLLHLRREARDAGVGYGGLLLVVHDSQVLYLPNDRADEYLKKVIGDGLALWDKWFQPDPLTGVPGGIDAVKWG